MTFETTPKCVVIHNGSSETIAGFNNSVVPQCVVPSSYVQKADGRFVFGMQEMLEQHDEGDQVFTIVDTKTGMPYNWDALRKQWEYIYENCLRCSPKEMPLVITLPAIGTQRKRDLLTPKYKTLILEQYCKIALEEMQVPFLQVIAEPLAVALSMGKSDALVVDISGNRSVITPILDGNIIKKGIKATKFAGDFLDYQIAQKLNKAQETNSLILWKSNVTWIKEFKKAMLLISDKRIQDLEANIEEQMKIQLEMQKHYNIANSNPLKQQKHFLLNGETIHMDMHDCYMLGEYLFQPQLADESFDPQSGIGEIISQAIKSILYNKPQKEVETRKEDGNEDKENDADEEDEEDEEEEVFVTTTDTHQMVNKLLDNVIIKGSTSLISGMEQRIINEISLRFPQYKITTFANQNAVERKLQSWTSAATMSKMGAVALGMGNELYTLQTFESKLHKLKKNDTGH